MYEIGARFQFVVSVWLTKIDFSVALQLHPLFLIATGLEVMSKHSGKDQIEFKFVLSFYKVENVAKLPSGTSDIQVEWTRGGSKGSSPSAAVASDTANWNSGANTIEVISNLFKDPGSSTFDEKTLDLDVVPVKNKKIGSKLTSCTLNLSNYVGAVFELDSASVPQRIEEKMTHGSILYFDITVQFTKNVKGSWNPTGSKPLTTSVPHLSADSSVVGGIAGNSAVAGVRKSAEDGNFDDDEEDQEVNVPVPEVPLPKFKTGAPTVFKIFVEIIQARSLVGKDSSGLSDPVVEVSLPQQKIKKYTSAKKQTATATWNESFEWSFKLGEQDFSKNQICIGVYDANAVMKNELIGNYSFSFSSVYKKPSHEVFKQWVALANSEKAMKGIQGYLQVSVRVLTEDDDPAIHGGDDDDDDDSDEIDFSKMVLKDPDIKMEVKTLLVTIGSAQNLPKMDLFGTCDPYVKIKLGGTKIRTPTVKGTMNPTFNQVLSIPIVFPSMTDSIEVTVWDYDVDGNEWIASLFLSLEDIVSGKIAQRTPTWLHFYGAPETVPAKMKPFVEFTRHCGRLLCSFDLKDLEIQESVPKPACTPSPPLKAPDSSQMTFQFDVWEAQELIADGKIHVTVQIGEKSVSTPEVAVKDHRSRIMCAIPDFTMDIPSDPANHPKVWVEVFSTSVMSSSIRLGYCEVDFADLLNPKSGEVWLTLDADIFSKHYKPNQLTGVLLVNLRAFVGSSPARSKLAYPAVELYELRTFLYCARDLPAADKTGTSDPFLVLNACGQETKSSTKKKTNNPDWNEVFSQTIELPKENKRLSPNVFMNVFDWDQVGSNTLMGSALIAMHEIPIFTGLNTDILTQPNIVTCDLQLGGKYVGKLLIGFALIPSKVVASAPKAALKVEMIPCRIDVFVLGLRDLKGRGAVRPLNKPYLSIAAEDVSEKGSASKIKTETSNSPSKFDPNYFCALSLTMQIPKMAILCPSLQLTAKDSFAISTYALGQTSLSLKPLLPWVSSSSLGGVVFAGRVKSKIHQKSEKQADTQHTADQVAIDIAEPEDDSNSETQPLLANEEGSSSSHAKSKIRVQRSKALEVAETELDVQEEAVEQLPVSVADDPIGGRPTVPGLLETTLGAPLINEYLLTRGSSRGVSAKKLKKKRKQGKVVGGEVSIPSGKLKAVVAVTEIATGARTGPSDFTSLPSKQEKVIVRLYVIRAFKLTAKDFGGSSDPFLQVSHGSGFCHVIDDKQRSLRKGTLNPDFYTSYEFEAMIPGDSEIQISVFDYDAIGSNEIIGSTVIDIENRWLNPSWRSMQNKPIEIRPLKVVSSRANQGSLEMWVDMFTESLAKITPKHHIEPPKPEAWELRVIIWKTAKCVNKDEGSSDLYVSCQLEGDASSKQNTDTHWKSEDGTGNFNYRMKFPVNLPASLSLVKVRP
jgi:hypothetical protein